MIITKKNNYKCFRQLNYSNADIIDIKYLLTEVDKVF